MADRGALGMIGLMLCAATVVAAVMATMAVRDHIAAQIKAPEGLRVVALPIAAR